jgi:hypothetical protein
MAHSVKMTRTIHGSYDGFTPAVWTEGQEYHDIPDHLLKCFVSLEACEVINIPPLETKPEPAMRRGRPRRDV